MWTPLQNISSWKLPLHCVFRARVVSVYRAINNPRDLTIFNSQAGVSRLPSRHLRCSAGNVREQTDRTGELSTSVVYTGFRGWGGVLCYFREIKNFAFFQTRKFSKNVKKSMKKLL